MAIRMSFPFYLNLTHSQKASDEADVIDIKKKHGTKKHLWSLSLSKPPKKPKDKEKKKTVGELQALPIDDEEDSKFLQNSCDHRIQLTHSAVLLPTVEDSSPEKLFPSSKLLKNNPQVRYKFY